MKRILCLLLCLALLSGLLALPASAAGFTDVPSGNWAEPVIQKAVEYGLMEGTGGGKFGFGQSISRGEFATVLARMFNWDTETPAGNSFTDTGGHWASPYIEAAAVHDAVDAGGAFRPGDPITRSEMAVMLVRALGYKDLAAAAETYPLPFTDVTKDRGYIAVAYDIGMTTGMTATSFAPDDCASREQAAAMLVRIYEKYSSSTEWSHAFYAISSYGQISLGTEMDAVSLGWSRMTYGPDTGVLLCTTAADGNEYYIPTGYESVVNTLTDAGVKLHLSVFMDTSAACGDSNTLATMLLDEAARTQAVNAILEELTTPYSKLGRNPYSGVTIDFEGLRGQAQRDAFTAFLTELENRLTELGLTLYVTVMPATADGVYFDGYDYRAIGRLADKVILMAHDYNPTSLEGFVGSEYYKNAALTPLTSVYYSLRAATDKDTGVEDMNKLVLAISCSAMAWETDAQGRLTDASPLYPTTETVYRRISDPDTVLGWSGTYRNPWAQYTTEEGQHVFLWYEDSRSVSEKLALARLFGVNSVSLWRLGLIPNYTDAGLYYDVTRFLS